MSGRRRHHHDPDHRAGERPGDLPDDGGERDPWSAFGASGDRSADTEEDDFWGDLPDWSGTASTARRTGRSLIGGVDPDGVSALDEPADPTPIGAPRTTGRTGLTDAVRGAWNGLLGTGAEPTREHRRVEAVPAAPLDGIGVFDDLDDLRPDGRPAATGEPGDRESSAPRAAAVADAADIEASEPAGAGDGSPAESTPIRGLERRWLAEAAAADRDHRSPLDPLLIRIGAVVIVACLAIPAFFAVLGGGDDDGSLSSDRSTGAPVGPGVGPAVLPPTSGSAPAVPATDAPIDPASLPPATPVVTAVPDTALAEPTSSPLTAADPVQAESAAKTTDDVTADAAATAAVDAPTDGAAPSPAPVDRVDAVEEPAAADRPAARVDPPPCPISYTVVDGDFWIRLAEAAGVELADLLSVNNSTVDTPLFAGAEICLPAGATTPAPPTTVAPTTVAPTTESPTTIPPTTEPPTTEPPGPEDIKQIIRDVWPDELEDRALEIAFRESRFDPRAKNFCCYGLFQIYWEVHDVWLVDLGITSASQLYDPETNARAAYALYQRAGGWGPWQVG